MTGPNDRKTKLGVAVPGDEAEAAAGGPPSSAPAPHTPAPSHTPHPYAQGTGDQGGYPQQQTTGDQGGYPQQQHGTGNQGAYPQQQHGTGNQGAYPQQQYGTGNQGAYPQQQHVTGNQGAYPQHTTGEQGGYPQQQTTGNQGAYAHQQTTGNQGAYAHQQTTGEQGPRPLPPRDEEIETLSGRFIWISLWRAFRLQIHTREVLASERKTLEEDAQHIVDPEQQAFLAWRRSVLLLVAIFFVPLTVVRFVEAFGGAPVPTFARMFLLFPAIAEAIFCAIAFDQLKNWTRWRQQRRILFIAWAFYMFAPFVVYLYPFRGAFEDSVKMAQQAAEIGGLKLSVKKSTIHMVVGLAFGVQALLALGPKVISLMPGLIRASIVSKLLFPGMAAPGWLMILAAPLYALFAYIIVLLPYQVTGSWHFVAGNAGLLVAQIFIAWSGRILTVPLESNDAHRRIHASWLAYILLMCVSAGFLVFGLYDFITQLNMGTIRIVSGVLSFIANVLLLTLIGTDAIVSGMAYFRKRVYPDPNRETLLRHSEAKLDRFSA